jgi:phosphoribosylformylglycinamidine synthase subunit PurS
VEQSRPQLVAAVCESPARKCREEDAEQPESALADGTSLVNSPGPASVWLRDCLKYNDGFMTAYVYVSLKKSVLDPQGKTIQGALKKMGYKGLESVRQGKYFELTLDTGLSREEAQSEVERIAREVLTNPVIEEYRFSLAD